LTNTSPTKLSHRARTALDFGPLLIFLGSFILSGKDVFVATAAVMVATVISLGIFYWKEKAVAPIPAFTCVVVVVFGGLTLYLQDQAFIMMKPTIVYVAMGGLLYISAVTGKNFMGTAMGPYMKMTPEGWRVFLTRFALFCLFAAALNEVLRRTLTFDTWLTFKVFGFTALFFLFSLSQTPFLTKHIILDEDQEADKGEASSASSAAASSQTDLQAGPPASQKVESDLSPEPDEND
jgi:intracellular septation protein